MQTTGPRDQPTRARGRWAWLFVAVLGVMCAGFIALGIWQVQRLAWKTALIERVETRAHAAPVAPPARADWPVVTRESHEYQRLRLQGQWAAPSIWVRTGSELGWGYWAMSPLQTADGLWVLVNRGFVPADQRAAVSAQLDKAGGEADVIGLLRLSEAPHWLRPNDLSQDRWAARDVPAMAAAMKLDPARVAPYFVDASASRAPAPEWPRPGLTVLQFSNNHLSYALTWFALALLSAGACFLILRSRASPGDEDTR